MWKQVLVHLSQVRWGELETTHEVTCICGACGQYGHNKRNKACPAKMIQDILDLPQDTNIRQQVLDRARQSFDWFETGEGDRQGIITCEI